jgi:hypothetical protein
MRPRYKVIAPYLHMNCKVGDIIDFSDGYTTKQLTRTPYDDQWGETLYVTHGFDEVEIKDFPHLFQPLPWWSDREISDMPEYVKWRDTGVVCKPSRYSGNYFFLDDDDSFGYALVHVDIATFEEYNEYQNHNQ